MLRVYIGWDPRDAAAYEVCRHSLLAHASIPVEAVPLRDWVLRARGLYWRPYHVDERGQMWDARDGKPFSTAFSYTRFCVPLMEDYGARPVVFCDADMLWRADVAELMDLAGEAAVACVKHEHRPAEREKMTGNIQTVYRRKNWSSLMVLRPSRCVGLTPYAVNNMPRDWLHGLCWIDDAAIKGLPEAWNWLEGWSDPALEPRVVHFTRGTPDMPGYAGVAYGEEWRAALREAAPNAMAAR
ncbi:MAG: hypothetical protein ACE5GS_06765 [Kiloniellaceae bacterium]